MEAIPLTVRNEIERISSYLADTYRKGMATDLVAICREEEIEICLDDYGPHFDGMLVWHAGSFSIHLNTARGNTLESLRGRFSLSHELGHFFLTSHRLGIQSGLLPAHPSNGHLVHSEKMEIEADLFASSLLMPYLKLRAFTARRKFSLDIIKEISKEFAVSLTAAAIRFANVGTHGVMVVFSENGIVKWITKSPDFIKLRVKCKAGSAVPPTSVVGESFLKRNARYTGVEKVDLEDWFYQGEWPVDWQLYEQCFYSDIYDSVISLVWFQ
jgi:Zn-dependent peptidase ImmA (M78 family)